MINCTAFWEEGVMKDGSYRPASRPKVGHTSIHYPLSNQKQKNLNPPPEVPLSIPSNVSSSYGPSSTLAYHVQVNCFFLGGGLHLPYHIF